MKKKVIVWIWLFFFLAFLLKYSYAIQNPAEVYCKSLHYQYKNVNTSLGFKGICILPNNKTVDAWKFLLGLEGQNYSYCAMHGYKLVVLNSTKCSKFFSKFCAFCVLPNGSLEEVTKLMDLSFQTSKCGDGICSFGYENYKTCPEDCPSGSLDGYCDGVADGICDPDCVAQGIPEKDPDCPVCGNGKCERGENYTTCCIDCGCPKLMKCINNTCTNTCGNGKCEKKYGENYKTCPEDCPSGSLDGYCDGVADGICDPDCVAQGIPEKDPDCYKTPIVKFIFYLSTFVIAIVAGYLIIKRLKNK